MPWLPYGAALWSIRAYSAIHRLIIIIMLWKVMCFEYISHLSSAHAHSGIRLVHTFQWKFHSHSNAVSYVLHADGGSVGNRGNCRRTHYSSVSVHTEFSFLFGGYTAVLMSVGTYGLATRVTASLTKQSTIWFQVVIIIIHTCAAHAHTHSQNIAQLCVHCSVRHFFRGRVRVFFNVYASHSHREKGKILN